MESPEKTAAILVEENLPIEEYLVVQNRRYERLETFKRFNNKVLIDAEQKLIDYGEKVIKLMQIAYANRDQQN